jgi:16S rRNA (uracil1498-N3)-methyltransferase
MSRIPRVYVDAPLSAGSAVTLPKASSHHLLSVLRLNENQRLELFNGDGFQYPAILHAHGKIASAEVLTAEATDSESPLNICLWQGLSRGERMDASVRQAVELGVRALRPVSTHRSQVRLDAKRARKRHEHWSAIIISAAEQSGRTRLTTLAPLESLDKGLSERDSNTPGLVLVPGAAESLGTYSLPEHPMSIDVLIGPESGLSDEEITSAVAHGLTPVSLGKRILRTETAGPCVISILQARFGDLK